MQQQPLITISLEEYNSLKAIENSLIYKKPLGYFYIGGEFTRVEYYYITLESEVLLNMQHIIDELKIENKQLRQKRKWYSFLIK